MTFGHKPPKFPAHWFRFSLRGLMLLVTVLGAWLAWQIHLADRLERQAALAAAFSQEAGGSTRTTYHRHTSLMARLRRGNQLYVATRIDVGDLQLSDGDLVRLRELTLLTHLNLSGTQITDAGLAHLTGLTDLRLLDLRSTQVTGAGARQLKRALPACTILR